MVRLWTHTHTYTHTLSHNFVVLSPVRENPESAACWSEGGAEVQEVRGSSGSSGDVSKSERYVLREVLD